MGVNYGILFTAWGVGGVFGPTLAGRIADSTGSYAGAYTVAGLLVTAAFVLAMFSYVSVSVSIPEKEVRIRIGRRPDQGEELPAGFPPQARTVAGADARSL